MSIHELGVVFLVGFLILGPKDLLTVAKFCVKTLRKIRKHWRDIEEKLCEEEA